MPMAFPPFAGATRQLVLANIFAYFGLAVLGFIQPRAANWLASNLILEPYRVLHGQVWQPLTYSFVNVGLLNVVFALLALWFTGSMLEQVFGARWLMELYFAAVVGGAVIASALVFVPHLGLHPMEVAAGAWGGVIGMMVAIAVFFGDQEFLLMFVVRMKAKYMVALIILVEVAMLLHDMDAFGAVVQLAGGLSAFLFVKLAPRRGIAVGLSESYFGVRNGYYRWKRRRAAKKFTVYMRKQNRDVHFDDDGRYIDPEDDPKDSSGKPWVN